MVKELQDYQSMSCKSQNYQYCFQDGQNIVRDGQNAVRNVRNNLRDDISLNTARVGQS